MSDPEILTGREGRLGTITLNRPAALNALSLGMIETITRTLDDWRDDPEIGCVLVQGAGSRGLCAGGDIRAMRQSVLDGAPERTDAYLATEYAMNARTAVFPKPYVAFMDGIVMGGGVGVSGHGSVRIVTERTRMAMPEVGIGLLPDVGGTFLLSRAPAQLGIHAGLTGASLTAFDAIACGMADWHVPSDRLPDLARGLAACGDAEAVTALVRSQATSPARTGFAVEAGWIARCYRGDDPKAIVRALQDSGEDAAQAAARAIIAACPMSVAVTLRALRVAASLDGLLSCLERERQLIGRLLRRADFIEGVRAAVVDKDRAPRWVPATLDGIDPIELDAMFGSVT